MRRLVISVDNLVSARARPAKAEKPLQICRPGKRYFDPITVPGRNQLVTLRDAALYMPKAEHVAEEW
jgi:hypothetical protein